MLVWVSLKLWMLCHLLVEVVVRKKAKLLIFAHWPQLTWMVETLLWNLGIVMLNIRTRYTGIEQDMYVEDFNISSTIKAIIVSNHTTATLINLHKDCHHVMFVNPLKSINNEWQCIGWVV